MINRMKGEYGFKNIGSHVNLVKKYFSFLPTLSLKEKSLKILLILLILSNCIMFSSIYAQEFDDFDEPLEDSPTSIGGFFRHGAHAIKDTSNRSSKTMLSSMSRLRLGVTAEYGKLSAEISGNGDFVFTNREQLSTALLWNRSIRNRLISAENNWQSRDALAKASLFRGLIKYNADSFQVSMGRQAISWGQGRLINPLDLITPVDPFIIDLEDVPGADSLQATWYFNDTDFIQAVVVPYKRNNNPTLNRLIIEDVNALARAKFTFGKLDASILGGRQFHSTLVGSDLSFDLQGAALRLGWLTRQEEKAEVNLTLNPFQKQVLKKELVHTGIVGVGYAFWGDWVSNFEVLSTFVSKERSKLQRQIQQYENLVSVNEIPPLTNDQSFFLSTGRILLKNPLLIQSSLSHQFNIEWQASFIVIADVLENSVFVLPQLTWSLSDESIMVFALQLYAWQSGKSTFSGGKQTGYVYYRGYF